MRFPPAGVPSSLPNEPSALYGLRGRAYDLVRVAASSKSTAAGSSTSWSLAPISVARYFSGLDDAALASRPQPCQFAARGRAANARESDHAVS